MIRINYDVLGISVSLACAIHCAILPLVLTSLPVLGTNIINHTGFELSMIAVSAVIGLISLWHGYNKHHHRIQPALLFVAGILLLASKQLFSIKEIYILIPAVIIIIWAHWLNYRLCRKVDQCHTNDCNHAQTTKHKDYNTQELEKLNF